MAVHSADAVGILNFSRIRRTFAGVVDCLHRGSFVGRNFCLNGSPRRRQHILGLTYDHRSHHPETLAAKVLGQDVGDPGHARVLLRGVLGADEEPRCYGCMGLLYPSEN